ncbi:hypothetical protein BK138_25470 [Paenibacillus rhizosphaerae]|uniref:Uncharacterized protein n=1 Tax=Paenibacillus rhizosphaerae TaxID=297318 RepID=A0A1R1EIM5_9BACL|nr:hypothetical protein BK138_25470 [Paenibacillus rhizosphaerae]
MSKRNLTTRRLTKRNVAKRKLRPKKRRRQSAEDQKLNQLAYTSSFIVIIALIIKLINIAFYS